jgi:DNA-binding HxlR family transcriptional regulator
MRTYGQWCSLAKALDVVGDRWTLLIVRELLLQGPCRFTDLRNGLPGIATNLLSTRIKELEETGLIRREAAPPPVATTLFHLTELGRGLEPALQALTVWGIQVKVKGELGADEEFRSHWMTYPIHWVLEDSRPDDSPAIIQLVASGEPLVVQVDAGHIEVHPATTAPADLTISGHPDAIMGLLMGRIPLGQASSRGLEVAGRTTLLKRVMRRTPHPALANLLPT